MVSPSLLRVRSRIPRTLHQARNHRKSTFKIKRRQSQANGYRERRRSRCNSKGTPQTTPKDRHHGNQGLGAHEQRLRKFEC